MKEEKETKIDRSQLVNGLILMGMGFIIFLFAREILALNPTGFELVSLIIRFVSYIFVVVGAILSIVSIIPKK